MWKSESTTKHYLWLTSHSGKDYQCVVQFMWNNYYKKKCKQNKKELVSSHILQHCQLVSEGNSFRGQRCEKVVQLRTSERRTGLGPSSPWSGSTLCLMPLSGGAVGGTTRRVPAERSGIRRWSSPPSALGPSSPCRWRRRSRTCPTPVREAREGADQRLAFRQSHSRRLHWMTTQCIRQCNAVRSPRCGLGPRRWL